MKEKPRGRFPWTWSLSRATPGLPVFWYWNRPCLPVTPNPECACTSTNWIWFPCQAGRGGIRLPEMRSFTLKWSLRARQDELSEEFEERFIKPIVNASYPATLAGLDLAVLQFSTLPGPALTYTFLAGAAGFLLSAFSIFSYSIYPTRKKVWTATALTFLIGISCSVVAVLLLLLRELLAGFV